MVRKYVLSSLMIIAFLLAPAVILYANTSSCVNCHTNDSIMKSLHKPPAIQAGEGEG